MSERTTGVLIGGIIALIGSIFGFWLGLTLLGLANTAATASVMWFISYEAAIIASVVTPTVSAIWPWIVFTVTTIALIFSIMLIVGNSIKVAAIIVLIAGILSIIPVVLLPLQINWIISGGFELVGAIIALATGALK